MCDKEANVDAEDSVQFEKCGEILILNKQLQLLTVCKLCQRIFMETNEFVRHVRTEHHKHYGLPQVSTDVASNCTSERVSEVSVDYGGASSDDDHWINELVEEEESDCIVELPSDSAELTVEEEEAALQREVCATYEITLNVQDGTYGDLPEEEVVLQKKADTSAENAEDIGVSHRDLAEVDSAIASWEDVRSCGLQQSDASGSEPGSERDSVARGAKIAMDSLDDTGNDSYMPPMEAILTDEAAEIMAAKAAVPAKRRKKSLSSSFDLSDEENKENTPPKYPLSGQVIVHHAPPKRLLNKGILEGRRPLANHSNIALPLKRKPLIKQEALASSVSSADDQPSGSKRPCNVTPPVIVRSKQEVLARMRNIKKRIFGTLDKSAANKPKVSAPRSLDGIPTSVAPPKQRIVINQVYIMPALKRIASLPTLDRSPSVQQAFGLVSSTPANAGEKADAAKAKAEEFTLTPSSRVEESTLKSHDSQSQSCTYSLDLTSENVDMDSIQVSDICGSMTHASQPFDALLDVSTGSLTDGHINWEDSVVELNATLHDYTADEKLLHKVGLRIISSPNLEDGVRLARVEPMRLRANTFARLLRKHSAIWRHNPQQATCVAVEAFKLLTAEVNDALPQAQLSSGDLRHIVNQLSRWYSANQQRRLHEKCDFAEPVAHYLLAFGFLPKVALYTLYCPAVGCEAQFRRESHYVQHQQSHRRVEATALAAAARSRGSDERAFSCSICQVKCANARQLYEHSVMHLKRIHACALCGCVLATAGDLQCHAQMCHPREESQPQEGAAAAEKVNANAATTPVSTPPDSALEVELLEEPESTP